MRVHGLWFVVCGLRIGVWDLGFAGTSRNVRETTCSSREDTSSCHETTQVVMRQLERVGGRLEHLFLR